MTNKRQELIDETLAGIQGQLDMTSDNVLTFSQRVLPDKAKDTHFPNEALPCVLCEVSVVWLMMKKLIQREEFERVIELLRNSSNRFNLFQDAYEVKNTVERDSIGHIYAVISCSLEILIEDLDALE
jgi:hypothetical protein